MTKCAPKRVANRSRCPRSTGATESPNESFAAKASPPVPGSERRVLLRIEGGVVERHVHPHVRVHLVQARLAIAQSDDLLRDPGIAVRNVLEKTIIDTP